MGLGHAKKVIKGGGLLQTGDIRDLYNRSMYDYIDLITIII